MSEKYQGTVQKVFEKRGRYSFLMDNDEWYGLGRKQPKHKDGSAVQEGDTVRFQYEDNHKGDKVFHNVIEGTLGAKKGDGPPPRQGGSQSQGSRSGGRSNYQAKEKYWEDKELRDIDNQRRISYSGALNTALTVMNMKFNEGLIKFTGKSVADKNEAFDAILVAEADRLFRLIHLAPPRYDELMYDAEAEGDAVALEEDLDDPDDEPFEDDNDDWD